MKRLIFILMAVFGIISCTPNKDSEPTSVNDPVIYDFHIFGDAEGSLGLTFTNGSFLMNGNSDLDFTLSNNVIPSNTVATDFYSFSEEYMLCMSSDSLDAFIKACDVFGSIDINPIKGDYSLTLKGYIEEPVTGITFSIDRTFTNRDTVWE